MRELRQKRISSFRKCRNNNIITTRYELIFKSISLIYVCVCMCCLCVCGLTEREEKDAYPVDAAFSTPTRVLPEYRDVFYYYYHHIFYFVFLVFGCKSQLHSELSLLRIRSSIVILYCNCVFLSSLTIYTPAGMKPILSTQHPVFLPSFLHHQATYIIINHPHYIYMLYMYVCDSFEIKNVRFLCVVVCFVWK